MKRWLISAGHGLLLIILYIIYLNTDWIVPFEEEGIVKLTKIETLIFPAVRADDPVLFINTSHSMALTSTDDEGKLAITDRAKLAAFFNFLASHNNQHRYLLCDIRFTEKSNDDSALAAAINRMDRYIFPEHIPVAGRQDTSVIKIKNTGIADYVTYEALFSKMMLSYSNYGHSLPLKMYEQDGGIHYSYNPPVLSSGFSWLPNSLFPRFYITMEEVEENKMSLGLAIQMININDTLFYNNMVKNKLIVIGDFENDVQPTAIGRMPGTVILLNCFLTLEYQHNWLIILGFIFLFICFMLISYYVFYFSRISYQYTSGKYAWAIKWFFSGRRLLLLLFIISITCLFIFRLRSTILPLWIYFELLEQFEKLIKKIKKIIHEKASGHSTRMHLHKR